MPSIPTGPGGSGDGDAASVQRAIDVALRFAQARFGLGCGSSSPVWVRDRVLTVLQARAEQEGVPLEDAARSLAQDRSAIDELERALRVGETRFCRDPNQWKAIEQSVVKSFPARLDINVLCAGCSTGEEAYTAAMVLRMARRSFQILGVDRSASAIAKAKKALYAPEVARDLPPAYVTRFCELSEEGLRVRSVITEFVSFKECDLVHAIPPGPFHLIFFKNVLLYLAEPSGEEVAARLIAELDESGLLFPAASEVLRLREAGLASVRVAPGVTAFKKGT
jgi:chemotaxis protein methyltransferase CheR